MPSKTTPKLYNVEAEQSVLGAVLLYPDAMSEVVGCGLEPEDFYHEQNRDVYRAMLTLCDQNKAIDLITVNDIVKNPAYLSLLSDTVGTAANIKHYVEIVQKKADNRRVHLVCKELAGLAASGQDDILDVAQTKLFQIGQRKQSKGLVRQDAVALRPTVSKIEDKINNPGICGITSGLKDLDRLTAGWQAGDLILLAGATSQGKTAVGINFALHAARAGVHVGIFSMEMSAEQIRIRFLSLLSWVSSQVLRTGYGWTDRDKERFGQAIVEYASLPTYLDDAANQKVMDLRAKLRLLNSRMKKEQLGLVIVDYIGLMSGDGDSREQEIASLSRGLKSLAKENNVPVIALAQLNRSVAQRQDKRPILSDLRDSGSLEQDSDTVIFVYRDYYYSRNEDRKNEIELLVRKQRQGPTDDLKFYFALEHGRVGDLYV